MGIFASALDRLLCLRLQLFVCVSNRLRHPVQRIHVPVVHVCHFSRLELVLPRNRFWNTVWRVVFTNLLYPLEVFCKSLARLHEGVVVFCMKLVSPPEQVEQALNGICLRWRTCGTVHGCGQHHDEWSIYVWLPVAVQFTFIGYGITEVSRIDRCQR